MIKQITLSLLTISLLSCKSNETTESNIEKTVTEQENPTSESAQPQVNKVEQVEDDLQSFIPKKYEILLKEEGDINLDGKTDIILVLKKSDEEAYYQDKGESALRPVLLLIRDENGKLQQARRNDKTVYGAYDGGMMGDPFTSIAIKNGYFSFEHYGGSAWRWTHIVTYKYDKNENEWFLHKVGGDGFHSSEPEKVETKVKSTKDFGKIKFEKFDIFKE